MFCNAKLPYYEVKVIRPPVDEPVFKTMSTGSSRKNYTEYADPPVIGTT